MKKWIKGILIGAGAFAAAAVTHNADIRDIVPEYPAIILTLDAMISGASLDADGYVGSLLALQDTKDVIVPIEMSKKLTAHYNTLRDDHAELIVYEGQPRVFTGKYKARQQKIFALF